MADLNIISAAVDAANADTVTAQGFADAAVNAGQVVWLDTSVSPNLLRLARANTKTQAQAVAGIALNSAAGSMQPLTYATAGDVLLPTSGAGSVLVSGSVYVLSTATAGGITPANDPVAGASTFISLLGVAASPNILRLNITPLGATR